MLLLATAVVVVLAPFGAVKFWLGKAPYSFDRPSYFPFSERAWRH